MDFHERLQRSLYLLKGDHRFTYLDELKKNLLLSRDELISTQNKYLQSLIQHAYKNTPYYRNLFRNCDVSPEQIKCKDDLKLLPPITKGIIRKNLKSISSTDSFGRKLIQVTSGGTTGEQGLIYISPYYMQMSAAFTLRSNLLVGWNPSDKWVALRTVLDSYGVKEKVSSGIRNRINRVYPLNALAYNEYYFDEWVIKIRKFKPKIIYGFSSVLLAFAKHILSKNIDLPSVQIPISTSEILIEREVIEKAFKAKVVNQYGSREILAIGLEIPNRKTMIVFDDNLAINQNESNEFVMTALHSYGFPLINYRIGDSGVLLEERLFEKNNLPFSQIDLKIGRVTDNFITHDKIHVAASSLITHLTKYKLGTKEQQIVQDDYKKFTVNYIPDTEFNSNFKEIINEVFKEYFGKDISIIFNGVDYIPLEKSGKKLMYKRVFHDNGES